MALPRVMAQIVIAGGQIFGRAFVEAWKQAGRNMRAGGPALGAGQAGSGIQAGDAVSRRFRMSPDEACNILNVKRDVLNGQDDKLLMELLENYERMMKSNATSSHYIQSKIVRARERIEAELPQMQRGAASEASSSSTSAPPP